MGSAGVVGKPSNSSPLAQGDPSRTATDDADSGDGERRYIDINVNINYVLNIVGVLASITGLILFVSGASVVAYLIGALLLLLGILALLKANAERCQEYMNRGSEDS